MLVFVLCVCSLPLAADTAVLFSDLGPPGGYVYDAVIGWAVAGSGSNVLSRSSTVANLFAVAGSGSLSVSEIDLAVGNVTPYANTFFATIWTDSTGLPGIQVADAYWSTSTSATFGTCCGLVSLTDITGVNLTGGDQYFMILGPLSVSDTSFNGWNDNNQGATGLDLYSRNGGSTWVSNGTVTIGAFDVLSGTPEPTSFSLMLLETLAIAIAARKRLSKIPSGKSVTDRR